MELTQGIKKLILEFTEAEVRSELSAGKAELDQKIDSLPDPVDVLENAVARKLALRGYERLHNPETLRQEMTKRLAYYCKAYENIPAPKLLDLGPWNAAAGFYPDASTVMDKVYRNLENHDARAVRHHQEKLDEYRNQCKTLSKHFLLHASRQYHTALNEQNMTSGGCQT